MCVYTLVCTKDSLGGYGDNSYHVQYANRKPPLKALQWFVFHMEFYALNLYVIFHDMSLKHLLYDQITLFDKLPT